MSYILGGLLSGLGAGLHDDAVARRNAAMERLKRENERADAAEDRAADLQKAVTLKQTERELDAAYPKPATPTDFIRNYEYLKTVDPTGAEAYRAQFQAGPPVPVNIVEPDGRTTTQFMTRGEALGIGGTVPVQGRPTIGAVVSDPRKQGGGTPTGSRTFR